MLAFYTPSSLVHFLRICAIVINKLRSVQWQYAHLHQVQESELAVLVHLLTMISPHTLDIKKENFSNDILVLAIFHCFNTFQLLLEPSCWLSSSF